MIGLPEYSVTLSGSPENPIITNLSGRTIIGYVLKSGDKNDKDDRGPEGAYFAAVPTVCGACSWSPRRGCCGCGAALPWQPVRQPVTTGPPGGLTPASLHMGSLTPIVRVLLDAVVFSDGLFAGPDNGHNFARMTSDVETFPAVGQQLVTAVDKAQIWQQFRLVEQHMKLIREDPRALGRQIREQMITQQAVAALASERNRFGEESAYDLAQKYSSMPALSKEK
jgi:hypothetical protein